ncbi:MAG: ADP-glyceromanno-heptose 6-epimerase [Rhabdochlamydiaceae bacterium]
MYQDYILITGAAGLIGSAVVRYLNDQGYTNLVLVDDVKKTIKWKNLIGKQFLHFISKENLFEWLKNQSSPLKAIIHLGACSNTLETDGDYLMENNYRYSIRLAEYAIENRLKFIYASSAATYGDGSKGFKDDHEGLDQLEPLNLYGFSKHMFDLWLKQHKALDKVVGLKYFNVFGPNEYHKGNMASMILKILPQVMEKGRIQLFKSSEPELYKDGGQLRDFIYVKDAARMTCEFLHTDASGLFNIGSGIPSTWNDLAKAIFSALSLPVHIDYIDMPPNLAKQYQNYTCADMTKHSKAVQSNAKSYTLEEAVKDYVMNYLIKDKRW